MVQVAAAIIQQNDLILVARRAAHKSQAGFWEFPGGKIENNESPEDCLRRELKEELNISVAVDQFLISSQHDYGSLQIELLAYLCTFLAGDVHLIDHDTIAWVKKSELQTYHLAPADIPIVNAYLNRYA